jgi:EAL domain-containing protein (putative c-di-GMP-specific phosphodiesterase class I)
MTTTAGGVETIEQLNQVRAEGCTEVQRYLFSPPRRASELAALFEDHPAMVRDAARTAA